MLESQVSTNQPVPALTLKLCKGWVRCFWACFSYFTLRLALAQAGLSSGQLWGSAPGKMMPQMEKDQQTEEIMG